MLDQTPAPRRRTDYGAQIREAGKRAARAQVTGDSATVRHWREYALRHVGITPRLDRATVQHLFTTGWNEA